MEKEKIVRLPAFVVEAFSARYFGEPFSSAREEETWAALPGLLRAALSAATDSDEEKSLYVALDRSYAEKWRQTQERADERVKSVQRHLEIERARYERLLTLARAAIRPASEFLCNVRQFVESHDKNRTPGDSK